MFLQWNTLYSVPVTKLSFLPALPYLNVNFKNWKTRHFVDSSLFVPYFGATEKNIAQGSICGRSETLLNLLGSLAFHIFVVLGVDGL